MALLGLTLSDCLDRSRYGTDRLEDQRAQAWGLIGNSRRAREDAQGAEQAFALAERHLQAGTGDPLERADLLKFEVSLRRQQGRHDEALRMLRRASAAFNEVGETHGVGKCLVHMSIIHYCAGKPEQGVPLLRRAIELIDGALEPRTLLCAWHDLIYDLAAAGQLLQAQAALSRARPLYRRFPEGWVQGRLKWAEARIFLGTGQIREARTLLSAAWGDLTAANLVHDAARVSAEIRKLPSG